MKLSIEKYTNSDNLNGKIKHQKTILKLVALKSLIGYPTIINQKKCFSHQKSNTLESGTQEVSVTDEALKYGRTGQDTKDIS